MPKSGLSNAMGCAYHVEARNDRRTLVVDCEGCTGDSDLSGARCYEGTLRALCAVGPVEGILLSGYVQTEYKGVALEALRGVRTLAATMERMAGRDPLGNADERARKEKGRRCQACKSHPSVVMGRLRERLEKDLDSFTASLLQHPTILPPSNPMAECAACAAETGEDLGLVAREFERLRGQLMYAAFGVVPRGDG